MSKPTHTNTPVVLASSLAHDELDWALLALWMTPTEAGFGQPGVFWGKPGCSKTSRIRQMAARLGIPCVVLSPGTHGEGMFGAIPVPVKFGAETRLTYPAPAWVDVFRTPAEDEDGNPIPQLDLPGVLFLDELTTCPPALAPALLGLLGEHKIGDTWLGPRVRVVSAANPPQQAASGYDLSMPAANRIAHLDMSAPSPQQWGNYMLGRTNLPDTIGDMHRPVRCTNTKVVDSLEAQVRDGWSNTYPRAAGAYTTFINQFPALLHAMPAEGDANASRAWASHRSNTMAVDVMCTAELLGASSMQQEQLMASLVGNAAATQFVAWRTALDLPDPAQLLDGQVSFKHDPHRLDRTMAVYSSCAALVCPADADKRVQRADALWKLMETSGAPIDLSVPAGGLLAKAKPALHTLASASKLVARLYPALKAAGIQ